jgi:hypothetical protein
MSNLYEIIGFSVVWGTLTALFILGVIYVIVGIKEWIRGLSGEEP